MDMSPVVTITSTSVPFIDECIHGRNCYLLIKNIANASIEEGMEIKKCQYFHTCEDNEMIKEKLKDPKFFPLCINCGIRDLNETLSKSNAYCPYCVNKERKNKVIQYEKLGEGSYGTVYKISDGFTSWAEKVMLLFKDNKGDLFENNLREANYHRWFPKSQNLINIHSVYIGNSSGVGSDRQDIIVTMPSGGETLHDHIQKTTLPYRISIFKKVFLQVCVGLLPIHSNGMTHSDIKPRNILINENGKVTLIDLSGVRFEINNTTAETSTISYCPPEFFNSYTKKDEVERIQDILIYRKYGPYNDIWSLGITMLEFIIGKNKVGVYGGRNKKIIERYVNSYRVFPVREVMEEYGLDPNYGEIKEITDIIECMLIRNTEYRIGLNDLYIKLGGNKDEFLPILRVYPTDDHIDYNDKDRQYVLNRVSQKLRNTRSESIKYSFELGISICDRYCKKSGEKYNGYLFDVCLYISTCFLSDDGRHGQWGEEIFGSHYQSSKSYITEVIKVLEFDIYRPTLYSYIQKKFGRCPNIRDRVAIFETVCDISVGTQLNNHGKSFDEIYSSFIKNYGKN